MKLDWLGSENIYVYDVDVEYKAKRDVNLKSIGILMEVKCDET